MRDFVILYGYLEVFDTCPCPSQDKVARSLHDCFNRGAGLEEMRIIVR